MKRKALVIVVGENLTEIRPIGAQAQNGKFSKMGLIESGDYGKYFSKKCRKIGKAKALVIVAGGESGRNPTDRGAFSKWEFLKGNHLKWRFWQYFLEKFRKS